MSIYSRRLRAMSRNEAAWRARQAGRTAFQRVGVRLCRPRWSRAELRTVVTDTVWDHLRLPGDAHVQYPAVHAELVRLTARRPSRFVLDPSSAREMRDTVLARWPDAAADAVTRADNIVAGRYDVLGYRKLPWISQSGGIDWHLDPASGRRAPMRFWADVPYLDPVTGDHKVIWELNRHQHWLCLGRALWLTGDRRYRREMIAQLQAWMAANPPLLGINWASMLEIAIRAISWTWGLYFLLGDDGAADDGPADQRPWLVDMLIALNRQLTHVEQNLSRYFSPNTHLTGEALGLYVAGVALPELAASTRWADVGRRILIEEIGRQIRADGGHVERSTHYQRYTLDFYLMALLTAERGGDEEAAKVFREAATRLAGYTRTMADDCGWLPSIGDDDGGMLWPIAGRACRDVRDSLSLAAVLLDRRELAPWGVQEEAVWIGGPRVLSPARDLEIADTAGSARSRTLPDSGFVVIRDASGGHATFDVARGGYLAGAHAHAGALSLTLTLRGQPLFIDPGTYTYTMNARVRDRLRATMSHNTVTIDDRSQATPRGPFHWQTGADGQLHGSRANDGFAWSEAAHDAYLPVTHQRTVVKTAGGLWLIADEVLGRGRVTARAHWHFHPSWNLKCHEPGGLRAVHDEGDEVWLVHDAGEILLAHGDDESGLGWYSPVYGTLLPAWTARLTHGGEAPFAMLTSMSERRGASLRAPSLEHLDLVADVEGRAIGARVTGEYRASVFLLRPGESKMREGRACGTRDYQTNARVLHYEDAGGRLTALDVVDASHALALRRDWISIAAPEPVDDLHAALSDDALDLCSSEPPAELRLQGGALSGVRRIRLNHREIDVPASDQPAGLVVSGGDWRHPAGLATGTTTVVVAAGSSLPEALRFPVSGRQQP